MTLAIRSITQVGLVLLCTFAVPVSCFGQSIEQAPGVIVDDVTAVRKGVWIESTS
ncbi:MAG: hypothetical protein ACI9HK_004383, partial [Pirellulaceae bacterium]